MILAIDPGVNFVGLSLLKKQNDIIEVIHHELINNTLKMEDHEKEIAQKYGSRVPKINRIIETLHKLYHQYKYTDIAIEGPFYNAMRPQAYGSLVEIINSIKFSIAIGYDINFYVIEPLLVKKTFSLNHMAKKSEMKGALKSYLERNLIVLHSDIDSLSEHEIDSIGIGFSFFSLSNQPTVSEV